MTSIRALTEADRVGLQRLIARVAAEDPTEPFSEFKSVDLARDGGFTVIADDGDTVIAAGHAAFHHGDRVAEPHWAIEVTIDPARRTDAMWHSLIAATVATLPRTSNHVVWARDGSMEPILVQMGYLPARRLAQMARSLPTGFEVALPAGVSLAPFRPGQDEDAWLVVNNAAFAGHPENGGLTKADLTERTGLDWFRAEDLLMAWEGATLLGSCWTKRHSNDVGEIYVIGVHPDHQGRGLGRALVTAGLEHLAAVGATTGMLYVDTAEAHAVGLYRTLGFSEISATTMYVMGGGPP